MKIKYKIKLLIFFLYYFIFKNYISENSIRKYVSFIRLVYSYSKKKVCTSSADDSTCRTVVFGQLDVSNNSVLRLKILRPEGKGYFLTIRRDYVVISYYLKYIKDIPLKYREVVDLFNNHKYEKYSAKEIEEYTYKCNIRRIEDIKKNVGNFPSYFLEYMRGESCKCPSFNLFKNDNFIKRAKLKCNYFNMLFTDSAIVYSRHCAIMDLFYFSVYDIDYPPIFNTYVDITLQEYSYDDVTSVLNNKNDLVTKEKKYQLNDAMTEIRDDYFDVWIFLRSESHGKRSLVNLSNDYILIPSSPKNNSDVISSDVTRNCGLKEDSPLLKGCDYNEMCNVIHPCLRKALMLPKHLFDLSGKTCNKLGVSLNKWRDGGGNFCGSSTGYCLSASLFKYYNEHTTSIGRNSASKYKIKNTYASEAQTKIYNSVNLPNYLKDKINNKNDIDIKDLDNKVFYNEYSAAHSQFIDYKYNGNHSVEIKFETNALEVYEIRPISTATITHITTPKNCSSNQSDSKGCTLIVHVWNNNKKNGANFSCHVVCTEQGSEKLASHVSPIDKVNAYIDADKNYAFHFIIRFLINKQIRTTCKAIVKDANGRECFKEEFELTSKETKHVIESNIEEEKIETTFTKYESDSTDTVPPVKDTCQCSVDLLCYLFNFKKCSSYYSNLLKEFIGKFVTLGILIIIAPSLIPLLPFIIKYFFKCLFLPIKICSFCTTRKNENTQKYRNIHKYNKYEKHRKKKKSFSSSSNDTSSSSSTESVKKYSLKRGRSMKHKRHKGKKKKERKISYLSQYSGTSLESTITYSTPSIESISLNESDISSNSYKHNSSRYKKNTKKYKSRNAYKKKNKYNEMSDYSS
ncbi:male gamete fusion factor HAP2, putative [Plasmodium gallinaceum]|uniref:Male gamete fusion factor HAP2, putative n=1 Tax=Plasmodium gallinaceum TaxID=5849 RepID=A0A1J1GSB2_PLAGA|nr:male gamete fusion factor HAP2, putative [Plasmodium gallinaceum]CRG94200.1 male gamete fusion factor HAP2, putative [Plasmodium gallinaceum]